MRMRYRFYAKTLEIKLHADVKFEYNHGTTQLYQACTLVRLYSVTQWYIIMILVIKKEEFFLRFFDMDI